VSALIFQSLKKSLADSNIKQMWCPVEDTDLPPRMAPRSAGVRHDGFLTARRRAHEKARRDAGSTAGLGNKKSGGGLLVPPL